MTTSDNRSGNAGRGFGSQDTQADEVASERAREGAARGQAHAGEAASDLAGAARAAADNLEHQGDAQLANLARDAAARFSSFANSLHERNPDDLIRDAQRVAKSNPALFLGGSVALGFGLARVFKATSAGQGTTASHRSNEPSTASHPDVGSGATTHSSI